jgi:hypothetical protein
MVRQQQASAEASGRACALPSLTAPSAKLEGPTAVTSTSAHEDHAAYSAGGAPQPEETGARRPRHDSRERRKIMFRFTRNPIYIGMFLGQTGLGIGFDSLWVLAMLVPFCLVIRYGVVAREEAYLERKFGAVYLDYKSGVRRWL